MENRSHALLAGLFVLFFVAAAALALWWFAGEHERTNVFLLETRGNLVGLNVGAQVRYRGVRAGKVREIRADPADPAILLAEIQLSDAYRLTDKTVAKLNTQGVTGIAYVMLEEAGENGRPLVTDGSSPPRLPVQPGLLQQLGENAADIGAQVHELSLRLNRLLDERNLANLSRSLDNLATASESLKALPELMTSLRAALSEANIGHLNALLAHLEKTADAAVPLAQEARGLVTTLNQLAQRLDTLALNAGGVGERLHAETLPRAEALMRDVAAATRRLDRLIETLNDTPQALLFGSAPPRPGPGEAGFATTSGK